MKKDIVVPDTIGSSKEFKRKFNFWQLYLFFVANSGSTWTRRYLDFFQLETAKITANAMLKTWRSNYHVFLV